MRIYLETHREQGLEWGKPPSHFIFAETLIVIVTVPIILIRPLTLTYRKLLKVAKPAGKWQNQEVNSGV